MALQLPAAGYCKKVDFNGSPSGAYSRQNMITDFGGNTELFDNGLTEGRVQVVGGGVSGQAIRVKYPKGQIGGDKSGAQFVVNLPNSEEMYLEYQVKFDAGFDWSVGGKLPGLAGGTHPTGGVKATGFNGWSARYMWREGGSFKLYLYAVGATGQYFDLGASLQKNKWHTIRQHVKMNSIGSSNGTIRTWLDGKLIKTIGGLEFTKTKALLCDKFFFSTFFGGGTGNWAPNADVHTSFDNILITQTGESECKQVVDGKGVLFEDFEDGDWVSNFGTPWETFTDASSGGKSTVSLSFAAGEKSSKSAHVKFTLNRGSMDNPPFVALTTWFNPDTSKGWDMSTLEGVSFSYKGGAYEVLCRLESHEVRDTEKKAYHRILFNPSIASSWTPVSAPIETFYQPPWLGVIPTPMAQIKNKLTKMTFQIKGNSAIPGNVSGEFWVDDIRLLGLKKVPEKTVSLVKPKAGNSGMIFGSAQGQSMQIHYGKAKPGNSLILFDLNGRLLNVLK